MNLNGRRWPPPYLIRGYEQGACFARRMVETIGICPGIGRFAGGDDALAAFLSALATEDMAFVLGTGPRFRAMCGGWSRCGRRLWWP